MEGIAIVCKSQFSFEDKLSPERLKSHDKNLQSFPWSTPERERNLNESWKPPQGPTFLHICSVAELSLSSSHSFFSGQGSLLQPSKSKLGFCKLFRENSFLQVFSISLWSHLLLYECQRAWQNCSIFCIAVIEVRIWPKYLLQAAIQFSLLLKREMSPDRTKQKPRSVMETHYPRWGNAFAQMN